MRSIDCLLRPQTIAVIGASNTPGRAGYIVMSNLLSSGFKGVILPVSNKHKSVQGVLAYRSVDDLPFEPDLAIMCTNNKTNLQLVPSLATKGTKCMVILATSFDDNDSELTASLKAQTQQHGIRVLGPNSLGIIMPWLGMNASFSPIPAQRGSIAFISQSAGICTTILDWANAQSIGFSAFISLGNGSDIGFDELLDALSIDSKTQAIILYIDSISDARRFISAARAASRNRRILVLKGGKTPQGLEVAKAHNQGHISLDIIYDSAIKRSGMLRVNSTHELFAAVETLTHPTPLRGERLMIVTNGGGPSIMATDKLIQLGGKLATITDNEIVNRIKAIVPGWEGSNPIDIHGDATINRYKGVIEVLIDSKEIDALLIMHSPSAVSDSQETAKAIIDLLQSNKQKIQRLNIFTNWTGELTAKPARALFSQAKIPTYRTPESAVTAFMHLVEYRRNQKQLMETPTSIEMRSNVSLQQAREWFTQKIGDKQEIALDSYHLGSLFGYYNLSMLDTWIASDPSEATHIAEKIGYPVAVKLHSPDIPHKSDVQGVMLSLRTAEEVYSATNAILDRVQLSFPSARVDGVLVQAMANSAGAEEIRVKVHTDKIFGPVLLMGQGGSEWDPTTDSVCALPPLNSALARYFIIRAIKAGVVRLQKRPEPFDIMAFANFLATLSQMVVDNPELHALDIHPVMVKGSTITIVDADIVLKQNSELASKRLAITPYPTQLEQMITLKDGRKVLMRPIKPEDEPKHAAFIHKVSKEDLYKRFFTDVGEFNHESLAAFTQIDYDREMAFVVEEPNGDILGVARAMITPDNSDAEFAVLIRSDQKGLGLGKVLMTNIINYCRQRNTKQISGMTMPTNQGMLNLAKRLGFAISIDFEDGTADMVLILE
ncbi:bifunctional acetate--CoA ligase family protein/GNAT family N-acetyltransferase [Vibrio agarivorans]|uniref:Bifunctional acetate--CoA ligase family protein/GNAT family N-acetyltransferase n=1 Tax=Vibrio agarivorans TaxID=153622 RepID=A0ABT7Y5G0_9VIBR|nr:bifunctional acetate--CoA ligase family protein/GNAT family N-acetyltransferase [Vibrio agarivorans]MDN2483211.1 bifunctional acetate--CoA ligase family protein/GNAT family N-acetyltransferase [Vibrio agarivorans]